MKKLLKWVLIVFAGLIVLAVLLPQNKEGDAADATRAADAAEASAAPAVKVSARELFQAYEANEIAADSQYKGKRIEISGEIESIASDMFDQPLVQLSAGEFKYVGVQGLTKEVAAGLAKGQSIALVCNGAGEAIGTPMLDGCAIK